MAFLLGHLFTTPFKFEFKWILYYVGIFTAINTGWLLLVFLFSKYAKIKEGKLFPIKRFINIGLPFFLVTPAEDGLFLVPLFYMGINYLTAGIASLLFASIHLFCYRSMLAFQKD